MITLDKEQKHKFTADKTGTGEYLAYLHLVAISQSQSSYSALIFLDVRPHDP